MVKSRYNNMLIIALALIFGIVGCAEVRQSRKNLKRIKYNKEWEKRENWKNYEVYKRPRPDVSFQRGAVAFLYKIKDNKTIILDNSWIPVTSEELKAETKLLDNVWSAEILGYNEELYGYLIYRSVDRPNVRIIDENTVRLFYHYSQTYRF